MILIILLVIECFAFAHIIFWFMFAEIMRWDPALVVFIDVPIIFIISIIVFLYIIYLSVVDYTTSRLEKELKRLKSK